MSVRLDRPMILWRAPSAATLAEFHAAQAAGELSYPAIGATREDQARPAGYNFDHNRIRLGEGADDFAAGCAALRAWRMFPPAWTGITPEAAPLRVGQTVALRIHVFGLWWLNAARIVYLVQEDTPVRRCGFAYGTLRAHAEEGEERFCVEQEADGSVWYDLRAFSRPRFAPVRWARPLARRLQRRFVLESQAAMRGCVDRARA